MRSFLYLLHILFATFVINVVVITSLVAATDCYGVDPELAAFGAIALALILFTLLGWSLRGWMPKPPLGKETER